MAGKSTKRRAGAPWDAAQIKSLVALYNSPKLHSIAEITYRLNQKYGTSRNRAAVQQRLVKLRTDGEVSLVTDRGTTTTSEEAALAIALLEGGKAPKKSKSAALAPREKPAMEAALGNVSVVDTKRQFALKTPQIQIQLQIEGPEGTDELLMKMAAAAMSAS